MYLVAPARNPTLALVSGRIVIVADNFDALTHSRPYAQAWEPDRAAAEIRRQSGQHFDPDVVRAFGALDPGTRAQMHGLIKPLWRDLKMTIVMVTHDIREAFALATRLIALDRPRRDPQAPERYGAKITYDLDLTRDGAVPVLGFLKTGMG